MITLIINFIGKIIRRLQICPILRFRIIYFCSSILNSRAKEWGYALKYLPKVPLNTKKILEVGATESLFIYELRNRGYETYGLDQRPFQEKLPADILFLVKNFLEPLEEFNDYFDYIVSISTFEHMGMGEYSDKPIEDAQSIAIKNSYALLKPGGKLILTLPIEYYGYTIERVQNLTKKYFTIEDICIEKGQTCVVLKK